MNEVIIDELAFAILEDFNKIPNRDEFYTDKEFLVNSVKDMLNKIENKNYHEKINYSSFQGDIKRCKKALGVSFMFNFMISNGILQHQKFKDVIKDKLNEFRNDKEFDKIKYWKGVDYYLNKLKLN